MTAAKSLHTANDEAITVIGQIRQARQSANPLIFTDIYQENVNIAIWQRDIPITLTHAVKQFVDANPTFKKALTIAPQNAYQQIYQLLGTDSNCLISQDIAQLVDMFCCLFDLRRAGLRLTTLDKAMCPRFHVDKVPCRLVSTYQGEATQWLPHDLVNRDKLGPKSKGLPDEQTRLYQHSSDIKQLSYGDVALLKGESWEGNDDAGLVHRSPVPLDGENRLLLTLDFSD